MAEWLVENLFILTNAAGAFVTLVFLGFAIAAIWGAIRRERFHYRKFMNIPWWAEIWLWLLSTITTATTMQVPEDYSEHWSLRHFDYDDFIQTLEFSLILHGVLFAIIYLRLRFNTSSRHD